MFAFAKAVLRKPALGGPAAAAGTGEGIAAQGAVHIFRIEASGRAQTLDWAELRGASESEDPPGVWRWVHIDRSDAEGRRWLEEEASLSRETREALLNDDTQPRAAELDGGLLVILRGRNRDAGGRIADLVSSRIYVTERRVISVRLRPFAPSWKLAEAYAAGQGPETPGAFLDQLIEIAIEQLEDGLDLIGVDIDRMEDAALSGPGAELPERRGELNALKRAVIQRQRYLRPQTRALARLARLSAPWLDESLKPSFKEAADQTGRIVEDLEQLRERASLVAEEMLARMTDRLNRTLVTLAVVSTVFLPLTVLTSLLGANLAGIPFAQQPWAFGGFVGLLGLVALASMLLVRRITRG